MSKPIHQEIAFKASTKRIYDALTDAKQFSEFTGGAPAESVLEAGGSFSGFGGMIVGRFLELIPNQRIVQAWRAGNWGEGIYSIVRFEIKALGSETRLVFDHTGFPEDQRAHLESGWHKMYWEPLEKYLA
jgi:activator of HSP90 ATPase